MLELVLNCLIILIVLCGIAIVVHKLTDGAKDAVHNCILCFKAVFRPSRAFYTYLILKH